ncbi:LamG domain-containing protein [Blastopirellula sp. J2-11]|uniref:LamG domain-containing protein n=1 Tax=Blastopirellula sp. J2-11 TaxID=2943192 RepID=UPI0021CA5CE2|nr:LamG domain-containing protein [Blastopirellula sp. J2-11]UUO07159.1 LamG domain-containing protein [Blastopirellula sp. J2-11]
MKLQFGRVATFGLVSAVTSWCFLMGSMISISRAEDMVQRVSPVQIEGLIAFWDFQETAGQPRLSQGPNQLALQEQNGPIQRVKEGVFGSYAARIQQGQWLMIDRPDVGALNLHGREAQVTVVAWVRRKSKSNWQAIAGLWDETRGKRQYCLFLNAPRGTKASEMQRYPLANRAHGHVSSVGGPTPGEKYCITYSSGATEIPLAEWTCVAMSYDGQTSRVYVNGKLDSLDDYNPFLAPGGLFDGKEEGAAFTVGAVHRSNEWGNFFGGDIGGLAIFDRSLHETELSQLAGNGDPDESH